MIQLIHLFGPIHLFEHLFGLTIYYAMSSMALSPILNQPTNEVSSSLQVNQYNIPIS